MKSPTREPLTSDEHVLARITDLIGDASRRQLWLMFLDADDIQLPILMPTDLPLRPGRRDGPPFATFVAELVKATECRSIVVVLERPGPSEVTDDDAAWFRLIARSIADAGVAMRSPMLSWSGGVDFVDPVFFS